MSRNNTHILILALAALGGILVGYLYLHAAKYAIIAAVLTSGVLGITLNVSFLVGAATGCAVLLAVLSYWVFAQYLEDLAEELRLVWLGWQ